MKTCTFLKSITLCACFGALGACQKKNESSTSQSSWFGGAPSTVVTIPATNEKIDTLRVNLDSASKTLIENDFGFAAYSAESSLLQKHKMEKIEAYALHDYSGPRYSEFAIMFQPPEYLILEKNTVPMFKATISALSKLPKHHGTVYFGQSLAESYVQSELNPGLVFQNNNFTSASTFRKLAEAFTGSGMLQKGAIGVLFEVENSCQGASVKEFSAVPDEDEILFLPMNPWKIVSKTPPTQEQKYFLIKMKEMLPCSR
jgi:hypothetical protein